MEKSPLTIKSLGAVKHSASVRRKVEEEEEKNVRKNKRKKEKELTKVPTYKVGDRVVLSTSGYNRNKEYMLAEVIDYSSHRWEAYVYYGIVLAVTDEEKSSRIDRLTHFSEKRYVFFDTGYTVEPVSKGSIKWKFVSEEQEHQWK